MKTPEQHLRERLLARIDRLSDELRDLRALVAPEPAAGELTETERREVDELAVERAARMRRRRASGGRP